MSVATKPPPPGWPRGSSAIFYADPLAAIDWLVAAFGFAVRMKHVEDGALVHSELTIGDAPHEAVVMVAGERPPRRAPGSAGVTQALFFYIDDVDAFTERARAAGAVIVTEPRTNDYGEGYWVDRSVEIEDPGGHRWWFSQRLAP